jgi:hypothetical protein
VDLRFPATPSLTVPFTAQWINTDGSRPATYIAYDIKYNKIFLSGDLDAYNRVYYWKGASPAVRFSSPSPI